MANPQQNVQPNSNTPAGATVVPSKKLSEQAQRNYISRNVVCIHPDATFDEAVHLMRQHHIGDLVVVEEKNGNRLPIGMITDRDIALERKSQFVRDVMMRPVRVGRIDDDVFTLINTMRESGIGRLPLVNQDGNIAGIVTAKNLIEKLVQGLNDLSLASIRQHEKEIEVRH